MTEPEDVSMGNTIEEEEEEEGREERRRDKKRSKQQPSSYEIQSRTIRSPPFAYMRISLRSLSSSTSSTVLDELTVRSHLTSALTQFLGLHGSAIAVDILKVEGAECWIRVPREDLSAVGAAVGGWVGEGVGWRVEGKGNWLSSLVGGVVSLCFFFLLLRRKSTVSWVIC